LIDIHPGNETTVFIPLYSKRSAVYMSKRSVSPDPSISSFVSGNVLEVFSGLTKAELQPRVIPLDTEVKKWVGEGICHVQ
jgi:hypothetical protein